MYAMGTSEHNELRFEAPVGPEQIETNRAKANWRAASPGVAQMAVSWMLCLALSH